MDRDFDVIPFSDGNGELYLGPDRSASWKRVNPGKCDVYLEDKGGAFKGTTSQGDKAADACKIWVEGNEFAPSLQNVTQIKSTFRV